MRFLTGTATGIVAIRSVDGRSVPGSMSERLIGAYRATWADPAFATTL
jgi:branched-subunit amino acid aminotransferase/4-amino-4-deoxychorismate lyase